MSSSGKPQAKPHRHQFPQTVIEDGSKISMKSGSGIVDEHNSSKISSSSEPNMPPQFNSSVSQSTVDTKQPDLKQTPSNEMTSSDIDHEPKLHLSETTCVFSDDLHMTQPGSVVKSCSDNLHVTQPGSVFKSFSDDLHLTQPVSVVKSSNQNLSEQVQEVNKQNGWTLPFKLPIPSFQFGWSTINPNHPETSNLNHEQQRDQHSCTPDTLGRDTQKSSTSPTTRLFPLLSSSIRLGGCFSLMSREFTPEDQLESCFSDQHIRVFVVTWNMQEINDVPESIEDLLLPLHQDFAADMYLIGTQESTPNKKEWELLLQRTLGPSFVLVQTAALGVLYLTFFLRRDLIWFCSSVKGATFATKPATMIRTKGGVGLSFTLFGSSFLFINSHFTANQRKVAERNSDMQRTAYNLGIYEDTSPLNDPAAKTAKLKFDYVFWCGDLNYRVDLDCDTVLQHISDLNYMYLLLEDQLTKEILQGNVFQGFSEQPITFPPSYKYNLETDIYDTSEKLRVPSWTDRVMFKSRAGTGITGVGYYSCSALKCSDHKPVCATFRVKLKPSADVEGIPDTIATFNREIYMTANRQRKVLTEQLMKYEEQRPAESSAPQSENAHKRRKRATSQICVVI